MEPDEDAGNGDGLTIEQAASAYTKTTTEGAGSGQPEAEDEEGAKADDLQASDEEEADEGKPDDEEGQAEDDDAAEPDTEEGRFVAGNGKVRLPDGTVSTVAELISGNLRDRDYRQKTMSLADEKRQFEEQSSVIKASQQQVNQQREYLAGLLEAVLPPDPDISMMQTDPLGYMEAKERREQFIAHLGYMQQQKSVLTQQNEAKAAQERERQLSASREALQSELPALRDPAKLKAFGDEIQSVAETYGFSYAELVEQIPYDHRMALVLRDAGKWRKLQASKGAVQEKVQGRPPVQKAGKREAPDMRRVKTTSDAVSRLRQTGSVEDAAAAYLASRKG